MHLPSEAARCVAVAVCIQLLAVGGWFLIVFRRRAFYKPTHHIYSFTHLTHPSPLSLPPPSSPPPVEKTIVVKEDIQHRPGNAISPLDLPQKQPQLTILVVDDSETTRKLVG